MRSVCAFLAVFLLAGVSQASVHFPSHASTRLGRTIGRSKTTTTTYSYAERRAVRSQLASYHKNNNNCGQQPLAMAIPGYGLAEQVFVGGFGNFLSIYNLVITARILLSWFPAAQGVALLQPVYQITDPYLNLFRGLIPPVFGLDLSPILAFFLLNVLTNVTAAVGAEIPSSSNTKTSRRRRPWMRSEGRRLAASFLPVV